MIEIIRNCGRTYFFVGSRSYTRSSRRVDG